MRSRSRSSAASRRSISVWLIEQLRLADRRTSYYLIAAAIVSTIVIATLRETAHEELA